MTTKKLIAALALIGLTAAGFGGTATAAEGCGPGWWRGPAGVCHPMATNRACPVGWHLGFERRRCWPNQGFERACPPGFHLGYEGRRCWPN
jgi:hypothetical protein